MNFSTWRWRSLVSLTLCFVCVQLNAADIIRNYPMGEADDGAEIGQVADFTSDTVESADDGGVDPGGFDGNFVPLNGFGTYVAGRNDDSDFAIEFDGVSDFFQSPRFDPRDFGGSFQALSQGWVKPSSEGEGLPQTIWALGTDNGGVGITEEGFWRLNSGGNAGSLDTDAAVVFDEWVHVAVLRGGNNGTLYLDGSVVARNDGFWNGPGDFYLGVGPTEDDPFVGTIDDFIISAGGFDPFVDIKFLDADSLSGVFGDVTQDGIIDQADYERWSENVGFNNEQGVGDIATLLRGDVDQNGQVNFFDFDIIRNGAAAAGNSLSIPEPATGLLAVLALLGLLVGRRSRIHWRTRTGSVNAILIVIASVCLLPCSDGRSEVIVAEDFLYAQPTKGFGAGGGFTRQDYGGGQNGPAGAWQGRWVSVGDGAITGADISEETFNLETDMFSGVTRNGLSVNWLERDFEASATGDQLYFGITVRSSDEVAQPNATFTINDATGPAQIGMGLTAGGFQALLGVPEEGDDIGVLPGPDISDGLDAHRLIGKLELNAAGDDERLTVWLDPSDVETAENSIAVEADVIGGIADLGGNLRLDHRASPGLVFWEDLAVGTTWESVAEVAVPRLTVFADPEERGVHIQNTTGTSQEVTFLQLDSEEGIVDRRWTSLADQSVAGFAENNPTINRLTESSLFGSLNLQNNAAVSWGEIYRTGDLVVHVGTADGLLNVANVAFEALTVQPNSVGTDFDDNGAVDVNDIIALCSEVAAATNLAAFDLNQDGVVNGDDVQSFLDQAGSFPGDANLDGQVAFNDFLSLANGFGVTDPAPTWFSGDFDCSGDVAFLDFLVVANNFGSSAEAAASVPEPSAVLLLLFAALGISGWHRRNLG